MADLQNNWAYAVYRNLDHVAINHGIFGEHIKHSTHSTDKSVWTPDHPHSTHSIGQFEKACVKLCVHGRGNSNTSLVSVWLLTSTFL
jgi:hypothetical protein